MRISSKGKVFADRVQSPSKKQLATAKVLISGDFTTKQDLLRKGGYAESSSKFQTIFLRSKGLKSALKQLGFTEENAKSVVGKILDDDEAKNRDRIAAAQEVFKVMGSYAPDKSVTLQARIDISDEKVEELRKEYEEKLKSLVVDKLSAGTT